MNFKPEILHICSYYISNKLYSYLFQKTEKDFKQLIYVPIKYNDLKEKNFFKSENSHIIYDNIIKPYHKYLYGLKIKSQALQIENELINVIKDLKLIHAHTLFSDGGTAYLINQKFNIPYIISIRNTDVNIFYKYAIHYRNFSHQILENAKKIIFLSYAYKQLFFNVLPSHIVNRIKNKCVVIPNGITTHFLKHQPPFKSINHNIIKLITVASLDNNKNIVTLIDLIDRYKDINVNLKLDIVGEGPLKDELQNYTSKKGLQNKIFFKGQINSYQLRDYLDSSDIFILISFRETFGISYIEAMSRGLPIIYTKHQGIYGFFREGEVGYSVEPKNINQIYSSIEKIISNYENISKSCIDKSREFSWDIISKEYNNIYIDYIN